ncbi:hypothetical protein BC937DRAFT_93569 [Endogone sp. FLAS-F59071]|nr:hypothetical protein BC937DRAFT_93569 [Endogone sp. FLAS-F59071]|eukprot:RUS14608.1 hypothetical protein BC937DRAFT_93569 [Endogone sp. FLAS-F59071]
MVPPTFWYQLPTSATRQNFPQPAPSSLPAIFEVCASRQRPPPWPSHQTLNRNTLSDKNNCHQPNKKITENTQDIYRQVPRQGWARFMTLLLVLGAQQADPRKEKKLLRNRDLSPPAVFVLNIATVEAVLPNDRVSYGAAFRLNVVIVCPWVGSATPRPTNDLRRPSRGPCCGLPRGRGGRNPIFIMCDPRAPLPEVVDGAISERSPNGASSGGAYPNAGDGNSDGEYSFHFHWPLPTPFTWPPASAAHVMTVLACEMQIPYCFA